MPRRLVFAALSLVLVLATGCQVHTTVTVDVAEDGSGTVEVAVGLDGEAMSRLPDLDEDGTPGPADLAALVRADDLVAAGWTVAEPDARADGTTWVRATRAFGTPDEAEAILAELTGPDGALRDLQVARRDSFGRSRYELSGTIDLSGGLEAFGDEGLAAALDGEPLGEDVAAIEMRYGRPVAEMFAFELTASLPGADASWSPRLGDEPVDVRADSTVYDWPVLGLAAVAVAALVALAAVLVTRAVRARRG